MKEAIVSSLAIAVIGVLATYGLYLGHDGQTMWLAVGSIAGLAGYQVGRRQPPTKPPATGTDASTAKHDSLA